MGKSPQKKKRTYVCLGAGASLGTEASRSVSESNNTYRLVALRETTGWGMGRDGGTTEDVRDPGQGFGPARGSRSKVISERKLFLL